MKRLALLCLIAPALMYAENLRSILEHATANNKMVASKIFTQESKQKDIEAVKSEYYPTFDIGGYYQRLDEKTPLKPDIYSGYAKIGFDIYDGGRKNNTVRQKKELQKGAKYDLSSYKKSLQLDIVQDFFNILSAKETLKALENKNIQLTAEARRVEKFFEVGSVTKDDVDKLKAALSNNQYQIETIKYQILSIKQVLSIKTGKSVQNFKPASIKEPKEIKSTLSDDIKSLKHEAQSLEYGAKSLNSIYRPKIKIEDTYSIYGYERANVDYPEGMDKQNEVMLSVSVRIFDKGAVSKQEESLLAQKMALQSQISLLKETQDTNIKLAMSNIDTIKAQIRSAKSSLESANSAYETILQKFKAGAVDNVAYLDALSVKTNAKAQYETALNNLQIAYASYYYHTNKDIKDFIQ